MTDIPHWPRLMGADFAAQYCGVSVTTFKDNCPVVPVRLGRRVLWDVRDLDAWVDAMKGNVNHDPKHWIGVVNGEDNGARA